jgi:hypothetical protein
VSITLGTAAKLEAEAAQLEEDLFGGDEDLND